MSVTEVTSAIGEWSLTLREDTPLDVLNKIGYFGHVAITAARVDPELAGDELMESARYVGVLRDRSFGEGNKSLKGASMAFWLGDEDDKGEVLEAPIVFTNATFTFAVNTILPDSLEPGSIFAIDGTYSGQHVFQSPRKALDYICSLYDAEWRIHGKGKLDAGLISDLYVTTPKAAVLRNRSGVELDYKALAGRAQLDSDVKDFTTRVLLLAEGTEATTVSATADIDPGLNPYVDLFGNPVKLTRIVSEQQTSEGNAPARAQLQLNRFTSPRDALRLSTSQYDIKGDVAAGDYVWVYDPDAKLIDTANPIMFHGQEIHPLKLRVFQMTWPVVKGMGVAYRAGNGEWVDLTDYIEWETGDTDIVVGGYNRSLTGQGASVQDPGSRPTTNSTIPNAPVWVEPFAQSTYQSEVDGFTRAQIVLQWTQPLNTDGSIITDGNYYEIRFRTGQYPVWPTTHQDMSFYQHNNLTGTQASPIPFELGDWQYTQVPWDATSFLMLDLTPGIPYDFNIRAVDTGTPPNISEWSDLATVQTKPDTTAPSTPAPPETIAGSKNAIMIVHNLGRSSGGTFNLEADTNHFQVHAGLEPTYMPDPNSIENGGTLLGKLPVNQGMIRGQIPAVGSFPLNEVPDVTRYIKLIAVDHFGNESGPSEPMQQTAELIDSAFISELTVSKVSAGTILANWILAAEIATASTGARVRIGWFGIEVWNLNNLRTLTVDSATGNVELIGKVTARDPTQPGDAIIMDPQWVQPSGGNFPTIVFTTNGGNFGPARINATDLLNGRTRLGLNSGPSAAAAGFLQTTIMLEPTVASMQYNTESNELRGGKLGVSAGGASVTHSNSSGSETSFMVAENNQIRMGAEGFDAFRVRNPPASAGTFIEAERYCGWNEGPFYGQTQDWSGGFYTQVVGNQTWFIVENAGALVVGNGENKTFVIDHPLDPKGKWLVHGCTESPFAGVEYWGDAVVDNGQVIVPMPDYFEALTLVENRQVIVTPIDELCMVSASRIVDGQFTIRCSGPDGTRVSWLVKAERKDAAGFEVEPSKAENIRVGNGPYTFLMRSIDAPDKHRPTRSPKARPGRSV